MLAISRTSPDSSRRYHQGSIPSRGDAWRHRTPAVITSSLGFKRQQLQLQFKSDTTAIDEQQPEEALLETAGPPKRGFFTAFRLMAFPDSDEDSESDYVPSEEEDEEKEEEAESEEEGDDTSTEELLESNQDEEEQKQEEIVESEEQEPDDDSRWWKSSADKRRWEKQYRQADTAFRKRFGCAIDTPAHPETRRKLRREKTRHRAYRFVLAGLVIAYLVQLALVYSASSWAFSMVAWRPPTIEKDNRSGGRGGLADSNSNGHSDTSLSRSSQQPVPEYVRTGLHLCATLSRRVVKYEHDVTATQHALRACDIAVKFAPENSREAIEAHVLRGDLRSLLSRFDDADEDYKAAATLMLEVESSNVNTQLAAGLSQDLDLKVVANRWTQLYKTKSFKELRREAKARAVQSAGQSGDDNPAHAVSELAADWLSAFKQKKPVLEVLTIQRSWTLRRLKYETLGGDGTIKPDVVEDE